MTEAPVPAHLHVFVDALGRDDAVRFLLAFGGAELMLGKTPREDSTISRELGHDVAVALGRVSDRLPRRIPNPKKWLARELKSKGLSHAQIARKLHTSDVTIRKYIAGDTGPDRPVDDRQLPLFD